MTLLSVHSFQTLKDASDITKQPGLQTSTLFYIYDRNCSILSLFRRELDLGNLSGIVKVLKLEGAINAMK